MQIRLPVLLVLFSLCAVASAQTHHDHGPSGEIENLGEIEFRSSGSAAGQPHFLRGLLLLHSFEFAPAARMFREAQNADPDFAMAYWGEAMTYNHPIWGEQDDDAARDALARLGKNEEERLAKAATPREKAYLQAVHALYANGSKKERDAAYAGEMERLARKYPDDLDARAFYALSLLGLTGTERNLENYMKAAAIAEEIYEINPRHPGALHYLIHAYDDPVHAPLGLRAARKYGKIAPAASHAQHMPSHIFFALGMWDDSIEANVASMATARKGGSGGYHPLHWLLYAYLQQGRRDEAAELVKTIASDLAAKPSPHARITMAAVCATWLIETGTNDGVPCEKDVDRSDIKSIDAFAAHTLARGLAALRRNDVPAAKSTLAGLEEMVRSARSALGAEDTANRYEQVSEKELALGDVMVKELRAAILFEQDRRDDALRLAAEAAATEESLVFDYGPPPAVKPPHELYGDLLVRAERFDDARVQYERALERTPGRTLTLAGLYRAATRSGKEERAREVRAVIEKQWRNSVPILKGD